MVSGWYGPLPRVHDSLTSRSWASSMPCTDASTEDKGSCKEKPAWVVRMGMGAQASAAKVQQGTFFSISLFLFYFSFSFLFLFFFSISLTGPHQGPHPLSFWGSSALHSIEYSTAWVMVHRNQWGWCSMQAKWQRSMGGLTDACLRSLSVLHIYHSTDECRVMSL
jgi:hypothetical protein